SSMNGSAIATAEGSAMAVGVAAGGSITTAEVTPEVEAYISGGTVTSTAGNISVTARFNTAANGDWNGDFALADSQSSSAALFVGLAGAFADATNSPNVEAKVSGGTVRATAGDISIAARSTGIAVAL